MLNSNLSTWPNPTRLADATFRVHTTASWLKLLRLPGGSWSNSGGWLSCEMGISQAGAKACDDGRQNWATRQSHFIAFLQSTKVEGMWVMTPRVTSKEAGAQVSFFNGHVTDTRTIGMDYGY